MSQEIANNAYVPWLFDVTKSAAGIGAYCDHAEHVEVANPATIITSGQLLIRTAASIAEHERMSLIDLYAARMAGIEQASTFWTSQSPDSAAAAAHASTWRDLQYVQQEHDRHYHPDVFGMAKRDKLIHYAFHVAKLAGVMVDQVQGSLDRGELIEKRLPDILIFGILLNTVVNNKLEDAQLPS